MIKTKYDKDFPDSVKISYRILKKSGMIKITDFWRALSLVYGIKEFELLNLKTSHALEFESYIIDLFIEWRNGKPINFGDIEKAIFTFGEFTNMEKLLFESESLQERLWAIYTFLIDPELDL